MDTSSFSPVETRPWAGIEAMQLERLRRQLAYLAAQSTFYQPKLAAAGVTPQAIRTLADLQRIPFTTKQELRDSLQRAP